MLPRYQNLRLDIRERYYFQEFLIKYVFFYKKENDNSLRNNQQCTSMAETKEPPISEGGEAEKALHQEYRNLRGDIDEWYYFPEYIFNNVFRHKNGNVNSLRDNQQSTSLEEYEMRKNHPICEKSLDTPLRKK